jgi:hypothetical protein
MSDLIDKKLLQHKTTALLEFLGQQDMTSAECQLVMATATDFIRTQSIRGLLLGGHDA